MERAAKRNAVYSNVFQGQTATNFTQPSTVSSTEISCIDAMRSRVAWVGAGMWWAPLSDFDSSLNLSMLLRACPFCLYLSNFLISDSFRIHRSFCGLGGPPTSATAPFCEQLIVASWFSFTWAWQACGPMMSYKCNEFRNKTPASSMTLWFLWPNVHTIGVNILYHPEWKAQQRYCKNWIQNNTKPEHHKPSSKDWSKLQPLPVELQAVSIPGL